MPRRRRFVFAAILLTDIAIVTVAPLLAIMVRFDGALMAPYADYILEHLPSLILIRLCCFWFFGLYHRAWRYASMPELFAIVGASTVSSALIFLYMLTTMPSFPRSIVVISWAFTIFFIGASRFGLRVMSHFSSRRMQREAVRVLIAGAGDAGVMVARELLNRPEEGKIPVGFIDDDPMKWAQRVFGLQVFGGRESLIANVEKLIVGEIIVAMP